MVHYQLRKHRAHCGLDKLIIYLKVVITNWLITKQ